MEHRTQAQAQTLKRGFWSSEALYICLLILLSAGLSFLVWMSQSLRLDEAQSIWQTSRSLSGVLNVIAKDVHVPLYFIGLHFWEILFGTSEAAIRLFSLAFYLFSIPAIFYLSRETYSPRVAYFAALITAISPFLNWYGSEARMYSLMFLLTSLSHLYFIRLWKKPSARTWMGYTLVTLLGIFTHLFFLFIVLVQAFFFVAKRELFPRHAINRLLNIAVISGAACLGWFIYRYFAGAGLTNPLLARPSSVDFFNIFSNFFIGFQTDNINTFYLSLWPLLVFVGFTFLAKRRSHEPQTLYFIAVSFVPVVLTFIISAVFQPIFLSRYLIICLPSLYVLAVSYLASYKGRASDFTLTVLVACMLSMLVVEAVQPATPVKEDFRDAAEYVAVRAAPSDIFVVSAPFITYPVEYYYNGAARLTTFPLWNRYAKDAVPEPYSLTTLEKESTGWSDVYGRVFLLLGYDQGYNDQVRLFMDKHYQRLDMKEFSPGLTLYTYKLRYF